MATAAARPRFGSDPLWRRAQACLVRGQCDAARGVLASFRNAGRGNDVHAHLVSAQIAWREDRIRDGTCDALDAAGTVPDDVEALCTVAGVLLETGESVAARDCLDRVAPDACDDPRLLMRLAALRKRLGQHAAELALLDHARALGHPSAALRYGRGVALMYNGRFEEAEAELASSLADAPGRGRVAVPLVGLRRQTPDRNYLEALDAGARVATAGTEDEAAFGFARYRTLEDLGRHDEAWRALARGNALMHACLHDKSAQHHEWLERLLAAASSLGRSPAPERLAGPLPIFIIGVPRSGTTLLERMLGNHPQVADAGELMDFGAQLHWTADTRNVETDAMLSRLPDLDYAGLGRRYLAQTQWRAGGKAFFIDKQPPNWVLAAPIHAALPWAPILHLVRDPMDTCFSNWRAYFGNACAYSYDLDALAGFYTDYRRVMARWHALLPGAILDVGYAELVDDPEATLRRVFDFCGLEWQPGCSDITRNAAPSATLSAAQVRSSVRRDTGGRWRPYAQPLARLAEALQPFQGAAGA